MIRKILMSLLVLPTFVLLANAADSIDSTSLTKEQNDFLNAAQTGDIKSLRKLLKKDSALLNIKNKNGMTPLMMASTTDQDVIVKELLKTGKAELEAKNSVGDTALAVAMGNEQYEVAKLLVEAGANVQVPTSREEGTTPFMLAVESKLDLAKAMYKKNKSILEQTDLNGNTALLKSVMDENVPAVKYLLSLGANKNHKNKAGLTAAVIANKSDNKELKSVLLK